VAAMAPQLDPPRVKAGFGDPGRFLVDFMGIPPRPKVER